MGLCTHFLTLKVKLQPILLSTETMSIGSIKQLLANSASPSIILILILPQGMKTFTLE
jgi:hypothetical protein